MFLAGKLKWACSFAVLSSAACLLSHKDVVLVSLISRISFPLNCKVLGSEWNSLFCKDQISSLCLRWNLQNPETVNTVGHHKQEPLYPEAAPSNPACIRKQPAPYLPSVAPPLTSTQAPSLNLALFLCSCHPYVILMSLAWVTAGGSTEHCRCAFAPQCIT